MFGMLWLPFLYLIFRLNEKFSDRKGRAPKWLVVLSEAIFRAMWDNYDGFFRRVFGDGERTIYGGDGNGDGEREGRDDGVVDGKESEGVKRFEMG